ncbi:hypothetical protein HMI56_004155, partial [Coelomomyces lativittatus]
IAATGFVCVGLYGYSSQSIIGIVSSSLPLACIIIGLIVGLVSVAGCCGAANESRLFLRVYFALLSILILCQIIIGGIAISHKEDVEAYVKDSWQNAYTSDQTLITRVQNFMNCCGLTTVTTMVVSPCNFTVPCFSKMKESFVSGMSTMATGALTMGIIEFICLLAAGVFVYVSKAEEESREMELLAEAKKLNLAETAKSKKKKYNFETPFEDGDD